MDPGALRHGSPLQSGAAESAGPGSVGGTSAGPSQQAFQTSSGMTPYSQAQQTAEQSIASGPASPEAGSEAPGSAVEGTSAGPSSG